ncbi:MAG: PucR family transcriptional regulator [Solirubrobacterales bacterium]
MAGPESSEAYVRRSNPWERLPPEAAEVMEAERQQISDEIVETLGREVPAYTRPLSGAFGDAVRFGVDQALQQFVAMVRDPGTAQREEGRRVYVALGRGELEAGRSIGALLAAYRLGAQVAWRRLADASLAAGLSQQDTNLLAESIFAYIDALSAESAEGYAQAQAERAGELDARRGELIELLVRGGLGADPRALASAAEQANWPVPPELAVVVWHEDLGRTPAARLPQGTIFTLLERQFVALLPEPRDNTRRGQLVRGFAAIPAGLGSVATPAAAPRSYEHARAALRLGRERGLEGIVIADEHRAELIVRADHVLVDEIRQSRLAVLEDETDNARARLTETLLAWLRNDGNVTAAAKELHVHAQTMRYRMARLRELLGDVLDDPDARFELEYALRAPD